MWCTLGLLDPLFVVFWHTQDSSGAVASSQDAGGEGVERCIHCFRDFPLSKLVVHAEKCRGDMLGEASGRFQAFLPSVHDVRGGVMLAYTVLYPDHLLKRPFLLDS